MKVILMTTPYFFVEEHRILSVLFDEGLDILHLCKPDTDVVYSERLLSLLPPSCHKRIVIHDHFHLKKEFGLRGIHLSTRNANEGVRYGGQVSCTLSDVGNVREMKRLFDYVFLGPLYEANSVENRQGGMLNKDAIISASQEGIIDRKVMAVGSVTLTDVGELRDLNFGGIVVLGDIWNRFNMHTTPDFHELISHFKKIKRAAD